MRYASLIGKLGSGDLVNLGVADGVDIDRLLTLRAQLRAAQGLHKLGKTEVRLRHVVLLCSNTAGGELKSRLKFDA